MKVSALMLGLFGVIGSTVQAEPITILGINLGMSREQMVAELGARGYSCNPLGGCDRTQNPPPLAGVDIGLEDVTVVQSVIFFCDALGSCPYSSAEVAQLLIDQGIIDGMGPPPEGWRNYWDYCGQGPEGDQICVGADEDALKGSLQLWRGTLKTTPPSFD